MEYLHLTGTSIVRYIHVYVQPNANVRDVYLQAPKLMRTLTSVFLHLPKDGNLHGSRSRPKRIVGDAQLTFQKK